MQTGLRGERYRYPAAAFVTGRLLDRPVRCLSAAQQLEWHQGYEPRSADHADVAVLCELLSGHGGPQPDETTSR